MSPRSKQEYIVTIAARYRDADSVENPKLLDEVCFTCGYHRKHEIRRLNQPYRMRKPAPRKRGKPLRYHVPEILEPLKRIWLTANLPCSKRLKVLLPLWLPGYQATYSVLVPAVQQALCAISAATIDRRLTPTRSHYRDRGRTTTKPGILLRKQIPIKTNQWDETRPGFLEAGTVAHCGESLLGDFVYTINFVDLTTG